MPYRKLALFGQKALTPKSPLIQFGYSHSHSSPALRPSIFRSYDQGIVVLCDHIAPTRRQARSQCLESIDSTCPIENWLCSVKNGLRAQIRTPSTKQHKPAQPTTHHPQAITPAPYFRSTLKLGSSCTFTGACGSATLNVTGPSAVRTQCVKVLPCPN